MSTLKAFFLKLLLVLLVLTGIFWHKFGVALIIWFVAMQLNDFRIMYESRQEWKK